MAAKIKIEAYEEDGVVFIPKELVDRRGWREGTELDLQCDGTAIKLSERQEARPKRPTSPD